MASSTASEIWSATLSGWPSETDSEVNKKLLLIRGSYTILTNSRSLALRAGGVECLLNGMLTRGRSQWGTEILLVPGGELGGREAVVLSTARLDLQRPQ